MSPNGIFRQMVKLVGGLKASSLGRDAMREEEKMQRLIHEEVKMKPMTDSRFIVDHSRYKLETAVRQRDCSSNLDRGFWGI
jgi:hypothetical protein